LPLAVVITTRSCHIAHRLAVWLVTSSAACCPRDNIANAVIAATRPHPDRSCCTIRF